MRSAFTNSTLFLLLAFMGASANAGPNSYQCTVVEELFVQSNGALSRYRKPAAIGQRFAVNRHTGAIVGPESGYWSIGSAEPAVLARGDSDNSFVSTLIGTARNNGVHATFLRIHEFDESSKKPFIVMSHGTVFSGLCE